MNGALHRGLLCRFGGQQSLGILASLNFMKYEALVLQTLYNWTFERNNCVPVASQLIGY